MVAPRSFPTRTLKVDPAFVTPPPEAAERIERESKELNQVWASPAPEKLWQGAFTRPVPQPANSAFGSRSVFNGEPRSQHAGADFRSPAGTPIKAPNAGRVVIAGSRYFSGDTVVIDHGQGLFSLFAHLSETSVKQGDSVKKGEVIGQVGQTGRVTGPHLHWAVRLNGARIDPLSLLTVLSNRGFAPPDPPTPSLAGAPVPRSALRNRADGPRSSPPRSRRRECSEALCKGLCARGSSHW